MRLQRILLLSPVAQNNDHEMNRDNSLALINLYCSVIAENGHW